MLKQCLQRDMRVLNKFCSNSVLECYRKFKKIAMIVTSNYNDKGISWVYPPFHLVKQNAELASKPGVLKV